MTYGQHYTNHTPLEQFRAGVPAKDVKCNEGLQLVIKSEDGYPACVKPETALKLAERNWGISISFVTKDPNQSNLTLLLSVNSTTIQRGGTIGIDISLENNQSQVLTSMAEKHWIRNDLNTLPCSNLPLGMSVIRGYYTEHNETNESSLILYPNPPCPKPPLVKSYVFQPLSDKVKENCDLPYSCLGLVDMKTHFAISGYLDNRGKLHPFDAGTYTIVGGDEWGDVKIQHFVVTNSS